MKQTALVLMAVLLGASAAAPPHSGIPPLLLRLHEVAIVWRVQVKQGAARREVLNEGLADGIGGAGGKNGHYEDCSQRSDDRYEFERAGGADAARCRNHRSRQRRDQRLTAIFRELDIVDLRKPAQHLHL